MWTTQWHAQCPKPWQWSQVYEGQWKNDKADGLGQYTHLGIDRLDTHADVCIYIYQIYNINISWHKVVYLILFHCIPYWRSCISLYIYTCIMMYMCMGIWDWEVMCSKVQCFELWFTLRWRPNAPSKAEYCGQFPCMLGLFLVASNLMPAESSSKMVIVPGTPMGPRTSANGRTALKKKQGVDGVSRNAIPLQFIWQLYIAI